MGRIRNYRRLSFRRRRALRAAFLAILTVRFLITVLPFRFWKRLLVYRESALRGRGISAPETTSVVVWAVSLASRHVPWSETCLVRALAAHKLLARSGVASIIHIGVGSSPEGAFQAHAWVQCRDVVVIGNEPAEGGVERFTLLHTLGAALPLARS